MGARARVCVRVRVCVRLRLRAYARVCMGACVFAYACVRACVRACMRACGRVCTCARTGGRYSSQLYSVLRFTSFDERVAPDMLQETVDGDSNQLYRVRLHVRLHLKRRTMLVGICSCHFGTKRIASGTMKQLRELAQLAESEERAWLHSCAVDMDQPC